MNRCTTLECRALPAKSQRCHCAACHRTFTSASAFDRHQALDGGTVVCRDPATRGLVRRADGIWARPGHLADMVITTRRSVDRRAA
jgi:hypothetical protein